MLVFDCLGLVFNFFNTYKLFIGNKDIFDVLDAVKEVRLGLSCEELEEKRKLLIKQAETSRTKINDQIVFPPDESNRIAELNFRVLSAYQTSSAILFQQTTDSRYFHRPFPKGLEICIALGSKFAEDKLKSSEKDKLLNVINKNKKVLKGNSLYFSYLNALEALLEEPETDASGFYEK